MDNVRSFVDSALSNQYRFLLEEPLSPTDAIEWRLKLVQYIKKYTLVLAAADCQLEELKSNKKTVESYKSVPPSKQAIKKKEGIYRALTAELAKAEILLWDREMEDFAISGQHLFWGFRIPDDLLSRQPELWIRNFDLRKDLRRHDIEFGKRLDDGLRQWPYQAQLIWPAYERNQLAIFDIFLPLAGNGDSLPPSIDLAAILEPGQIYPSSINPGDTIRQDFPASFLVTARIEFLKSTIVGSEKESLPRNIRRQAEREIKHEPIVRVVHLRKKEQGQNSSSDGAIDYQHQWLVRPHWRNQYYPSTKEHRPVFIDAYVKGPEDKPFKPPKDYVFKVDR